MTDFVALIERSAGDPGRKGRLEDIRKYVEDAGETWYYRGMLSELIGHIDELHKAVSVDTSGAVDFGAGIIDPNRIAQILVNGKWVDAEVVREAAKRLGMVERGGAVVVPEKMPTSAMDAICYPRSNGVSQIMQAAWGACRAAAQAIPADRVLADGMVGVDREEWEDIRSRILAISPVHHDNCDGSSGPYWVCRMCGEHTSGEYENKPSPLDMHHSSECPIDALRSAKGEVK